MRIFILLIICIIATEHVSAAPSNISITGTITDGSTITISGTDLSSPTRGYKFLGGTTGIIEAGTNGQTPTNIDGWVFDQGTGVNPIISNIQAHSGTKSIFHGDSVNSALRLDFGTDINPGDSFYATWWIRFAYGVDGQWKMFRLDYENDIQDGPHQIVLFNWTNSSDQLIARSGPDTSSVNDTIDWYPPVPTVENRWYRMELEVTASSVRTSDGTMTLRMYDPTGGSLGSQTTTIMSYYDAQNYYRWFIWQNYSGNGITDFEAYIDDHYVQAGSVARVELCDASTWSNRTHCEIQEVTSWSSSLTAKFNIGSFSAEDTAYFYIVDDLGSVSPGYEVTVGGMESVTYTTTASGSFTIH